MESLKVLVKSIDEYNEAKNLVYELNCDDWVICQDSRGRGTKGFIDCKYKQVTIAQLRDMAVLKRNDVSDATHRYHGCSFYLDSDGKFHQFMNTFWFSAADCYWDVESIKRFPIQNNDLPSINGGESLSDQVASAEEARKEMKADNVNNPSHYNKGGIECIEAIKASMTHEAFCGYLKGNVQKYMWRYEVKGGVESLQKAQWYLNKLIECDS